MSMTDPRDHEDHELSRIYREGAWPEPKRQLDEAILAAARRAARARREASLVWRWAPRFALAATVVLTFTVVLRVYQEQPETVSPPVREVRPAARVEQRAAPAAPELKKEAPEPAGQRDQGGQSGFQSNRAQPDAAAGAARADSVQRQPEQAKQSPRTFELAIPRERQPEPQPEPMRAPLRVQESPSTLTAPAAPAPSAGVLRMDARSSASERSAQTWLEDIRKLKAQGRTEEAERELAEFKKRYPDYRLPEDLR